MAKKTKKVEEATSPELVAEPQAGKLKITVENLDPAFTYTFVENELAFEGMIVRMNDGDTPERFFVFAGHDFRAYTMPIDEAFAKGLTQARRVTSEDRRIFIQTLPNL